MLSAQTTDLPGSRGMLSALRTTACSERSDKQCFCGGACCSSTSIRYPSCPLVRHPMSHARTAHEHRHKLSNALLLLLLLLEKANSTTNLGSTTWMRALAPQLISCRCGSVDCLASLQQVLEALQHAVHKACRTACSWHAPCTSNSLCPKD